MREIRVIEYGTIHKVIIGKKSFILEDRELFVLLSYLNEIYEKIQRKNK